MLRLQLDAGHAPAGLVQLDHRGLAPGADVEHAAVLPGRGQRRARHVADVDVVARLPAVAEDARRPAFGQRAEEDRDHARLAVRVLPRPVDVAVAQRDVARPVEPVVRREVLLAGELRDAVGRERPALGLLRRRPVALAVDRAARRAEDDLRRRAPARPRAPASVPSTFTEASCSGRSTDTRTSTCAARWKQTSGRTSSKTSASPARMSRTTSCAPSGTFSRLPFERSSTTVTSSPRASSASTTCEPMNPAPPVTIARTASYPRSR